MNKLLDDTPLTFGKHKGETPNDIAVVNPQYVVWMYDNMNRKFCTMELRNKCEDMSHGNDEEWHELSSVYFEDIDPWG